MSKDQLDQVLDFSRGELDYQNKFDPGWSGPTTTAYMEGYNYLTDPSVLKNMSTEKRKLYELN